VPLSLGSVKSKPIVERILRPFNFAAVSCLLLAFVFILALVSNRPESNAANVGIMPLSGNPAVTLYTEDQLDIIVWTSQAGSVSSTSTDVRVVVSGGYGYFLFINTDTPGMEGEFSSLAPIAASIQSPGRFASNACNAWGFATPSLADNYSNAFDASYNVTSSQPVANHTSNYAAVPTVPTLIHESNSLDETRQYFFAACVNNLYPPDSYVANVTWTAVSIDTMPPVTNGTIMQLVNGSNCPAERTMVVDARDNKTYWVRKIPGTTVAGGGDLCWMETNLAYGGGGDDTYGDVIPVSTQAASGTADGLALHTAGSGMGNTNARYIVPSPLPSGAPVFTINPTPPTTGSGAAAGADGAQYGYLYNCGARRWVGLVRIRMRVILRQPQGRM
jgi:hypothetical protein